MAENAEFHTYISNCLKNLNDTKWRFYCWYLHIVVYKYSIGWQVYFHCQWCLMHENGRICSEFSPNQRGSSKHCEPEEIALYSLIKQTWMSKVLKVINTTTPPSSPPMQSLQSGTAPQTQQKNYQPQAWKKAEPTFYIQRECLGS